MLGVCFGLGVTREQSSLGFQRRLCLRRAGGGPLRSSPQTPPLRPLRGLKIETSVPAARCLRDVICALYSCKSAGPISCPIRVPDFVTQAFWLFLAFRDIVLIYKDYTILACFFEREKLERKPEFFFDLLNWSI